MNWKFLIYYIITVFLVNYIINDFKKEKAEKANYDCSVCKVHGCRGHSCASARNVVLDKGEAKSSGAKRSDEGSVAKQRGARRE